MNGELQAMVVVFAAAVVILVLIQVAAVVAALYALGRLRLEAKKVQEKLRADGIDLYQVAAKSYRLVDALEVTLHQVTEVSISASVLLAEGRADLARVEAAVSGVANQAEEMRQSLKRSLSEPALECRALARAVSSALAVFFRRPGLSVAREGGPREDLRTRVPEARRRAAV